MSKKSIFSHFPLHNPSFFDIFLIFTVNMNFTTESNVYFDIYEGEWDFEHGRNPVYSTGRKTYKELSVSFNLI